MDIYDTDYWNLFSLSKQYLIAAKALTEDQNIAQSTVFAPTLMLAAHGLELLLKGCASLNGVDETGVRSFSHDIMQLLECQECALLKKAILEEAGISYEINLETQEYKIDGCFKDPELLIQEYIRSIADLHGKKSSFALRYGSKNAGLMAPKSPFVVDTLYRVADEAVRKPFQFKIDLILR